MPATPSAVPLPGLLSGLWADLQSTAVLWQIGILALCLAGGWLAQRRYNASLHADTNPDETLRLRMGGFQRLAFPVAALLLVLTGRAILQQWQPVNLLNVAVSLLVALALVRITIYMLRHVFAPGGWLRGSERYLAWTAWIGFAIYIGGLWPALRTLLHDIGFTLGQQRISLLLIVQGLLSVGVTVLLALWLGRVIESRVMGAASLNVNLRVMLTKLAQVLLLLIAILVALPAVGIDLTVLSVFGGMLGVGIGFGLQKIASNYISGFIILMDRSVSIGNQVTVDKYTGQLTKMTARYVVVRANDGTEAIIPNETMITSPVVNLSYSDKRIRVGVPVQVAYQSDLDVVAQVLADCAGRHARVLAEPAPKMLIREFADSGINVELGVWIEDPQAGTANLRSDLYFDIWREFRARGIEIPYPQREVRLLGAAIPASDIK
jgi:small-conductance mechanosensitive channel